jgi:hypothetical protein
MLQVCVDFFRIIIVILYWNSSLINVARSEKIVGKKNITAFWLVYRIILCDIMFI